jgi:hypothetical protein
MRGGHPAFELDVAAQLELVGDIVQIALRLPLCGEMLLPVPFVQQFLEKEQPQVQCSESKCAPG